MASSLHRDPLVDVTPTVEMSSLDSSSNHMDRSVPVENLPSERHPSSADTSSEVSGAEGGFSHAQSSSSNVEFSFPQLRVRTYEDGDNEDYDVNPPTSSEFSDTNSVSPTESFKEFFAHSEAPIISFSRALMKLNELKSGKPSLDTSVLENTSEENFRFYVMEIALANNLSLDDDVVLDILNTLSPLVGATLAQNKEVGYTGTDHTLAMPVAKLTTSDDNDQNQGSDDVDVYLSDVSDMGQSENMELLPRSVQGLPIRVADDEPEEQEVLDAFGNSILLNQQETFSEISEIYSRQRGKDLQHINIESGEWVPSVGEHSESFKVIIDGKEDEELNFRKGSVTSSKYSVLTASGASISDNAHLLPARCVDWGHTASSLDSWIFFSRLNNLPGEIDDARRKLQMLHLKLLRVALRLGQSKNNMVEQVLCRFQQAYYFRGGRRLSQSDLETMWLLAQEQEARCSSDLDLECTVMVLGKSGAGKSATINSLFGKVVSVTDAYKPGTKQVKEIIGTIYGLKVRVVDTPGFRTSFVDKHYNLRILSSIKHYIRKSPPDIVLYVDRLDVQCRDHGDLALFQAISGTLGVAIWYNTIIVFTHGSSIPLDGSNDVPVDYELFLCQRVYALQETICRVARDSQLLNPVSIVENHVASQRDRTNHHNLPSCGVWKRQLLFLCFASKITLFMNEILKLQGKPFDVCPRLPSLPFLLALLLRSRAHLKLPNEQAGHEEEPYFEEGAADSTDEVEYEEFSSFRHLTRELTFLDKLWRTLYCGELEYRKELSIKKQLKDKFARTRGLKTWLNACLEKSSYLLGKHHEERSPAAAMSLTMPEKVPLPSFALDSSTHRYPVIVRPLLDSNESWYNGLSMEKFFLIAKKVPVSVSGEIFKDKKEMTVQMECTMPLKGADLTKMQAALDTHILGRGMLHGRVSFRSLMRHTTTCAFAVAMLGDTFSGGMKLEDSLAVGKGLNLSIGSGIMTGQQEFAYGGHFEASFKDTDCPIGPCSSTIGVSLMNWQGNLAIDGYLQLYFLLGQTVMIGQANLKNTNAGQISFQANSYGNQFQMALIGLLPLLCRPIFGRIAGFQK